MNADILKNTYTFFVANQFLTILLKRKQASNIISGIHALTSTIISGMDDIKHLRTFSSSYFIYDILNVILFEKNMIKKIIYIYHHTLSIFLLTKDSRQYPIQDIIFWGELSNLPSYPLYYLLHSDKKHYLIPLFQTLQKILYTGIRIPIITNVMIKTYKDNNLKMISPFIPMYLIGIFWSFRISLQPTIRHSN